MITINKLDFAYTRKQNLFKQLELKLEPGKIYGLLGKNGTGKSTLLKLINGALFPNQGSIKVLDTDTKERSPKMLSEVFLLPERSYIPSLKIKDFIKAYQPFYPKFNENRFYELLEIFEVDAKAHLSKLSYGQSKKVLISFGLATNASYLLLDEPTNGLDIPSKSQFRKALLKGFDENQIVVISTHQIRDLNQLIESVIILEQGKIIFHNDLFSIEEKLYFSKSLGDKLKSEALYSEAVMGGYVHILPNQDKAASEVELEVLFNAIIQNKELINQQINK